MVKILTNDNNATPQAGGSVCAVKTILVEFEASDLTLDAEFNLGPHPKGWNYSHLIMQVEGGPDLDTGSAITFSLGAGVNTSAYCLDVNPRPAVANPAGGVFSGYPFELAAGAGADMILKITTAPMTATDGTLRIVMFGYA